MITNVELSLKSQNLQMMDGNLMLANIIIFTQINILLYLDTLTVLMTLKPKSISLDRIVVYSKITPIFFVKDYVQFKSK